MKTKILLSIIIVVIVIAVFLFFRLEKNKYTDLQLDIVNSENKSQNFDVVPEFSLKDLNGNTVSLSDSDGKVRVINSWATWCPFCVDELPDFVKLQEFFGDNVIVIAIGRSESLGKIKNFSDELGVTYGMTMLLDPEDSFYTSIGGFSMPETLFVDGDGNIRIHKRGPMEFEEMKEKVEAIINNS